MNVLDIANKNQFGMPRVFFYRQRKWPLLAPVRKTMALGRKKMALGCKIIALG